MSTELQARCELLVRNREVLQSVFRWNHSILALTGATIFTGQNVEADPETLKECKRILKQYVGAFSTLRGNLEVPLVCNMALSPDPVKYLLGVKDVYERMNRHKIFGSEYRLLAAMNLYENCEPGWYDEMIERTEEIYQKMKDEHPLLTGGEDIPFAAMLAVSGSDAHALIQDMEVCYTTLKPTFRDRNALQSLTQILALSGSSSAVKCRQVVEIFEMLKEQKHRYGAGYELASLGALTMLDMSTLQIADLIIEADDYLKPIKGFGNFTLGAAERRMFAAMMVVNTYKKDDTAMKGAVLSGTLAIVIAIEICIIACIAAASSASS